MMLQQTHTYANTGLQSFADASPDYDMAPVGLGSMQEQARKLAEYGRNGDIYVVHAAEGETVVPMEVLDANPKVRELLFNQMREMGLDPQEFVIGDDLNSINPVTGMPEFFFKSVFRGVKKAIKGVVKFAKKAAPIALPIVAAAFGFPFLGPAFSAGSFGASALAGGLGSLAQGGSFKDALKAGVMSGGISALSSGVMGGLRADAGTSFGQGFMGGLEGSLTGATPVFKAGQQIGTRYAAAPYATQGLNLTGASEQALAAHEAASTSQWDKILGRGTERDILGGLTGGSIFDRTPAQDQPGFRDLSGKAMPSGTDLGRTYKQPPVKNFDPRDSTTWFTPGRQPSLGQLRAEGRAVDTAFLDKGDLKKGYNWLLPKDSSAELIDKKAADLIEKHPTLYGGKGGVDRAVAAAKTTLNPSAVEKYWKPAALATGAAYAAGAFDPPERDPGMSDEEWEEEKRKARNPYWYPTQKEGETAQQFAERSEREVAPYKVARSALDPFRFMNRGGLAQYGHQNFRSGGYVQGYNTGGSVPDWATGLPTGLRYTDGRVGIDPVYSSVKPTSGKTYGWENVEDDSYERYDAFDPQAYFWNLYNREGIRDLGGGFRLGQTMSHDNEGNDRIFFEIQSTGGGETGGETGGGAGGPPGRPTGPTAPGGPIVSGEHVNPVWNPSRKDRETDSDYGERVAGLREPFLFSDEATQVGRGMFAAEGGLAQYPRREMLVEGPGTERSDDIPAMLSDGEFVLNARSVRGADPTGQGDRYRGARNLYNMMRNFEMRA